VKLADESVFGAVRKWSGAPLYFRLFGVSCLFLRVLFFDLTQVLFAFTVVRFYAEKDNIRFQSRPPIFQEDAVFAQFHS